MISILGGVGLIFFGVRFLRKGLDRLFGNQLMVWLARATTGPLRALLTGIGIGAVAPSSTGASVMTVQMLGSGRMAPPQMLAVLLGTNIGITIAVQLLAFRIQDYAGLMIFAGIFAFQFLRREVLRGIGQCLLALGFVFLAIDLIGGGARGLAASADVREVLHVFSAFPWLLLVSTAVLSIMLQSSTASIGLGIAMASGGLVPGNLLGWWVIGTNLGIGFTSLAAAWGSLDGRRIGTANLVCKMLVAAPLLIHPEWLEEVFRFFPGSEERQAAMLHTGFNVAVALAVLPILSIVWRLMRHAIPDEPVDHFAPVASYLDEKSLEAPSLALARASRECMRMAERVRYMLEQFWCAYSTDDPQLARRVQQEDDSIDAINLGLKDYLIRIDEGLAPGEVQWQFALHGISSDLEAVGDVIDKHLCDLLLKQIHDGVVIKGQDRKVLEEAMHRVLYRVEVGIGLLTTRDVEAAAEFVREKEVFNEWLLSIQRDHYLHLNASDRSSLASSASFLDLINGIRRVNSHISALGYAFINPSRSDASGGVN